MEVFILKNTNLFFKSNIYKNILLGIFTQSHFCHIKDSENAEMVRNCNKTIMPQRVIKTAYRKYTRIFMRNALVGRYIAQQFIIRFHYVAIVGF